MNNFHPKSMRYRVFFTSGKSDMRDCVSFGPPSRRKNVPFWKNTFYFKARSIKKKKISFYELIRLGWAKTFSSIYTLYLYMPLIL
jgi:hypothetical protein